MNAQASLFDAPLDAFEPAQSRESEHTWRDYDTDPVPHIRHLPIREQIKRCAARYVHRHRFERCDKAEDIGDEHREITWAEWFWLRYGQTLDDYEREIKQTAAVAASTKG